MAHEQSVARGSFDTHIRAIRMLRAAFLATLALATFAPTISEALSLRDTACRRRVGIAVRGFSKAMAVRTLFCHREREAGRAFEGTDCNAPDTWDGVFPKGAFFYSLDSARPERIVGMCNADSTLAGLGYTSCPAPCDGLPLTTEDELAACMTCVTLDAFTTAATTIYGTPPIDLERGPQKCQERFGRHFITYLNRRLFLQDHCQFKKERGKPGYAGVADCSDLDDPSHPSYSRLQSQIAKLDRLIDKRCSGVDLGADLATCGSDVASLQACIKSAVDTNAVGLFSVIFP